MAEREIILILQKDLNIKQDYVITLKEQMASNRRVTKGGRGREFYLALFQKLGKSALILGKNDLIVVIHGLNFSFKMQFLRVSRRKNLTFSLWGISFLFYNYPALKNSWIRAWVTIFERKIKRENWPNKTLFILFI